LIFLWVLALKMRFVPMTNLLNYSKPSNEAPPCFFGTDEVAAFLRLGGVPQALADRINVDLILIFAPRKSPWRELIGLDGDIFGIGHTFLRACKIGCEHDHFVVREPLLLALARPSFGRRFFRRHSTPHER
jgi:hypothetical protein